MNNLNEEQTKILSYRQKTAVDLWIRNGRKSKAEALRLAGYSQAIVRQPQKVFDSPAVQRELELRGYGINGMNNNQKPVVENFAPQIKPANLNFLGVTKENIQILRERLEEAGWKPNPAKEEEPQTYGQPSFYIEDNKKYPPTENFSSM